MNIITSQKTYATVKNATEKLAKEVGGKEKLDNYRWLIAVAADGVRFVPTVLGNDNIWLAHRGVMVVS